MQCTGRGSCACGVCTCQTGFFGPACECDERDCINEDTGIICSGRGTCGCNGQCMCDVEPISQMAYNGPLLLCECTPNTQNCIDPSNRTVSCHVGIYMYVSLLSVKNDFGLTGTYVVVNMSMH